MLETRLRNHIDALADPVDISDVLGRTPKQTVGDELAPDAVVHEPEFVLASEVAVSGTLGRRPVLVAAVLVVLALVGLLIAARVGGSPTTLVADEESAAVAVAPAGEVSAAAVQSDDFDRCLDVLDTPPQEGLLVTVDDFGQVFVESRDQFDLRVELCEAIINATIERELTGSSTGKALPMSPEQSAALEDGVSDDELEQAWRRFVDCFEGGGGELLGGDSPDYNYSYAAGDEFVHDACASWHFERVSIVASLVRQKANETRRRPRW